MIKEIKITNFYSFSQETIVLQPDVNLLIGINGSGKSNFFKVVKLLKEGVVGKGLNAYLLEDLGGFDNIFFKGNKDSPEQAIEIEYCFDGDIIAISRFSGNIYYKLKIIKLPNYQNFYVEEQLGHLKTKDVFGNEAYSDVYLSFLNGNGALYETEQPHSPIEYRNFNSQELALKEISDSDRYIELTLIKNAIKEIAIYDHFDTTSRSSMRRPIIATSGKRLNADGGNLAQILNTIKLNHKSGYKKIVEMLGEVNPNFLGFDFNVIGGSNIELMLDEKGLESSIHVSSISDGTLKYVCLLAILCNPQRGKFICIDEPEIGLHPDMIHNITSAIKQASEQCTMVISTHLVSFLDYFNIENLSVFEKDDFNSTKVQTYKEEQFKGWYEEFAVGKMWIAGDFGGVRYGG